MIATGVGTALGAPSGSTIRISVGPGGRQANGYSETPAISADGRRVAFASSASNLVPGDTNRNSDAFVRDVSAGVTGRVSVGPGGRQGNGESYPSSLSADGRYVAFESDASNLVPGDTNRAADVFVRDLTAGVTRRVSVGPGGRQSNSGSYRPSLSADGRYVAFVSDASNLVAGDTNHATDVFVRDLTAGVTRRVSVGPGDRQSNRGSDEASLSADGRYVAFDSEASNLVAGDTNHDPDVFVRDLTAGVTRRVSVGPGGRQANEGGAAPRMAAGGRYVAFTSEADLTPGDDNYTFDVFVRDLMAGVTRRVSVGPGRRDGAGASWNANVSADGRRVVFQSDAPNLVAGDTNDDTDVFLRQQACPGSCEQCPC